jgi:dTMP kinase
MFITFEGIDGCGKSTQIKLLSELLESKGFVVHQLREPGGTKLSESIRELLLSTKNSINDLSELLLFEAARANLIHDIIKPALERKEFILCDRFFDSTTAYQGYGRQINLDIINSCNKIATDGIEPDLTFYLKISLETAATRSSDRKHDRIEKAGNEFFERVILGFENLAIENPNRIKIIDAEGSIENTKNKILAQIPIFNA